jgi:putative isomerase
MRAWFTLGLCLLSIQASALDPAWKAGFQAINQELENNLQDPNGHYPYFHAHPAPKYPGVYLWDSSFISLIWGHRDPHIAKDIIRSVIVNQQDDGRIPHVVSIIGASKWTQPPVLSYATAHIANATQDVAFAEQVYGPLKGYQDWLWRARRLKNGLFFWDHPYESGLDNSPRFGRRDESAFRDTHTLAAIDLSSYIVVDAQSLKSLAQLILSKTAPGSLKARELEVDIARFDARATEVTQLIQTKLWDAQTGYFYDLDIKTGQLQKIRTVASFFPLFAGVATPEQYAVMKTHLLNPAEFNTPIPVPTVARNSTKFEKDCWRGPVWVNTAYMVIKGLDRYGDHAIAQDFSKRLITGVYKTWERTGKFTEYYDPERYDFKQLTRKKGNGPFGLSASKDPIEVIEHLVGKQWFLGDKPVKHFVGWTGLVNVLAVEEFQ